MDDGNRVRTTSALRCFEVKIDRRGAKVKCKLDSKEMHMVSASNITAVATLDAPTLAAAKTALEHPKWRADMFKGIGDLGDYLQRFNNLGQLGGGARRAQVEKVNADAHHIYVKRIWPLSRDVGAARRIECVRMQSELRRLWLGFAFDEGSTAVVGDEFFQLMLASSQADFVHHLRPEYVPGLSADLPMPRMGREVRRERLQRQQTEQRTPTSPSMMSSVTAAVRGALSRSPARKTPRAAAAAPPSPTGWRLRFEEILKRVIDPSEAWWPRGEHVVEKAGWRTGAKKGFAFAEAGSSLREPLTRTYAFFGIDAGVWFQRRGHRIHARRRSLCGPS